MRRFFKNALFVAGLLSSVRAPLSAPSARVSWSVKDHFSQKARRELTTKQAQFLHAHDLLPETLKRILDAGKITGNERFMLDSIARAYDDEWRYGRIEFVDPATRPGLFQQSGPHRLAITGRQIADPIYVNAEQLERLSFEEMTSILVHEYGHHHGHRDDAERSLDKLSATVRDLAEYQVRKLDEIGLPHFQLLSFRTTTVESNQAMIERRWPMDPAQVRDTFEGVQALLSDGNDVLDLRRFLVHELHSDEPIPLHLISWSFEAESWQLLNEEIPQILRIRGRHGYTSVSPIMKDLRGLVEIDVPLREIDGKLRWDASSPNLVVRKVVASAPAPAPFEPSLNYEVISNQAIIGDYSLRMKMVFKPTKPITANFNVNWRLAEVTPFGKVHYNFALQARRWPEPPPHKVLADGSIEVESSTDYFSPEGHGPKTLYVERIDFYDSNTSRDGESVRPAFRIPISLPGDPHIQSVYTPESVWSGSELIDTNQVIDVKYLGRELNLTSMSFRIKDPEKKWSGGGNQLQASFAFEDPEVEQRLGGFAQAFFGPREHAASAEYLVDSKEWVITLQVVASPSGMDSIWGGGPVVEYKIKGLLIAPSGHLSGQALQIECPMTFRVSP